MGLSTSFIPSAGVALIALAIGTLTGYGLAGYRCKRWRSRDIAMWMLWQGLLPPGATVSPFFAMFRQLGMLDTWPALILTNVTFTIPFAVVILRDDFRELPVEIEEADMLEGASPLRASCG